MSKGILRPVMGGMAALLAVTSLAGVGCGSSGTGRPGSTGGSTGSGGTATGAGGTATGTGGTTGSGGTTTGTGGAAGAAAPTCTANPTTALLTNFGSAAGDGGVSASGAWGTTGQLTGHTFGYKGAMTNDAGVMSSVTATVDRTAMDLELKGTVLAGDYAGGGMSFDTCVDSTMWTGIQFTIGGTTDGCNLAFQLQTLSQEGTSNHGTCTASCYNFPNKSITVPATPAPMTILFSDLEGTGMPATAAEFEMEMFGLQWQFTSAAPVGDGGSQTGCSPDVTITNVMWIQ